MKRRFNGYQFLDKKIYVAASSPLPQRVLKGQYNDETDGSVVVGYCVNFLYDKRGDHLCRDAGVGERPESMAWEARKLRLLLRPLDCICIGGNL